MPRKKYIDEPVRTTICLPRTVKEAVDAQLADPLTGRPPYGAFKDLITKLLREWLDERGVLLDETEIDLDQLDEEV